MTEDVVIEPATAEVQARIPASFERFRANLWCRSGIAADRSGRCVHLGYLFAYRLVLNSAKHSRSTSRADHFLILRFGGARRPKLLHTDSPGRLSQLVGR